MTVSPLNPTQIEILKMFEFHKSEEDFQRFKHLLIDYLYQRAVDETDKVWNERGYTQKTMEEWQNEHMRVNIDELRKRKILKDK